MNPLHILATVLIAAVTTVGYSTYLSQRNVADDAQPSFGAFTPVGGLTYRLQSSVGTSNNSITLSSFKNRSGIALTMSNLNTSIAYGTLDPQSSRSEFISFTGITQNADGTATLTGVVRGLADIYPFSASTTMANSHPGQSIFILSDSPSLFNEYGVKRNDETISGTWNYTALPTSSVDCTGNTQFCNKAYIDAGLNAGGATSTETNIGFVELATNTELAAGTASSSAGGPLVAPSKYFKSNPASCNAVACAVIAVAGKIAQGFINLTELFTFTGGLSSTGTTTISAASTTTNPLVLNGRAYSFSSAPAASSTVLTIDSQGNARWATSTTRTIYNASPNTPSASASTTHATVVIDPNVLAVGSSLRYTSLWRQTAGGGNCLADVLFGNGSASTSLITMGIGTNINHIGGLLMATGTTGQVSNSFGNTGGASAYGYSYGGYNLAAKTYLQFVTSWNGSATCVLIGANVEVVQQ